jgi:hypothetical protein
VGEILLVRPSPSVQTHLTGEPKKTRPRWVALAGRGWPVGLLSFSQIISLSLLNDKKKEEGRRSMGEVGGRKWERIRNGRKKKKKEKKKKFSVLECRIIL